MPGTIRVAPRTRRMRLDLRPLLSVSNWGRFREHGPGNTLLSDPAQLGKRQRRLLRCELLIKDVFNSILTSKWMTPAWRPALPVLTFVNAAGYTRHRTLSE